MKAIRWLSVLSCFFLGVHAHASEESGWTVVELFTSQGCHSCPPADDFLGVLDKQPNTIAIACHVTYWNYLGWKDSFSHRFCDERQRAYSGRLKGYQGVYTPQMVVNGEFTHVGSRKTLLQRAVDVYQAQAPLPNIELMLVGKQLKFSLPSFEKGNYQLYLLGHLNEQSVSISRGENGGKKLNYHNPVSVLKELGGWDGKAGNKSISINRENPVQDWVVIAQQMPLGKIIAAGRLNASLMIEKDSEIEVEQSIDKVTAN